jgi:lycopene cyclase domain-containing protein
MTYLQFLLIFIIPLVIFEFALFRRIQDPEKSYVLRGIFLLAILAVIYTTPWDNYLIMTHVWSYEEHRVIGKIGYVPIEEYSFFILQSFLSGLWVYFVQRKVKVTNIPDQRAIFKNAALVGLVLLWLLSLKFLQVESSRYMGLILVWAVPVMILQWAVGGRYLVSNLKVYMWGLIPPTIYLCVVDAIAISLHVWKISMTQTMGISFGPLPLEEAVFFLVTNVMLVQGLVLFIAMKDIYPILKRKFFWEKLST